MSTHDKNGRPWAKLSELKTGDKIEADAGFTCIPAKKVLEVKRDENGLYVDCEGGGHHLKGQADDGEHCIGFYKVSP